MKLRIGILIAVLGLALGVVIRVLAQSPLPFFTIVFIPDIHYDFLDGSPNIGDQNQWNHGIRPWILGHAFDTTWNVRGVVDLGDIVSENNGVNPSDWDLVISHFQQFWDAGLPTVLAPGNHDADCVSTTSWLAWNSKWGPKITGWLSQFPANLILANDDNSPFFSGGACTPAAATQYARVDIPTTAGTIKVALTTSMIFPTGAALNELKAQADIDTDRNVVFGTHMFLQDSYVAEAPDTSRPCVRGSTSLCPNYPAYTLRLTGDDMWSHLKTFPRLVGIANGHLHVETGNEGYHSALLTGDAGNKVQAVSTGLSSGALVLAKFRTDNNTIEWYAWDTCKNPQTFPNYTQCAAGSEGYHSGAWVWPMRTEAWAPIIGGGSSGVRKRVANGKFDGRVQ